MDSSERPDGPRVHVVSATCQEFEGRRYYLCGKYFQDSASDGEKRLHRAVWIAWHGAIHEDHHVHHCDGDRSNNQPENLFCLPGDEHNREHGYERADEIAEMGRAYQARTKAWHGSEAGKKWHTEQYEKTVAALRATHSANCSCCGKQFEASSTVKNGDVKYCSKACKAHARRQSGVDDVTRVCTKCAVSFIANRYSTRKFCDGCFPARRSRGVLPDSA